MTSVNDWIVREYFELLGYLVSQPCKYAVPGRHKRPEEEIDLVVQNPQVREHKLPARFVWTTQDLKDVGRAVVGVRGWHTERFYVKTFEQAPDILRFVDSDTIRAAAGVLGDSRMAKILCLPRLPASSDLKDEVVTVLKQKGVDGVITFKTILSELVYRVDTKRNYEKSDILQVIRLLKNYDLLRDSQMELFGKKRRRKD